MTNHFGCALTVTAVTRIAWSYADARRRAACGAVEDVPYLLQSTV